MRLHAKAGRQGSHISAIERTVVAAQVASDVYIDALRIGSERESLAMTMMKAGATRRVEKSYPPGKCSHQTPHVFFYGGVCDDIGCIMAAIHSVRVRFSWAYWLRGTGSYGFFLQKEAVGFGQTFDGRFLSSVLVSRRLQIKSELTSDRVGCMHNK